MPAANQYLPFANNNGANVLTPTEYAALASRSTGFVAGIALSEQLNTVWRQSSMVTAMIGQFIADIGGFDANDDGVVDNLLVGFENTLQSGKLIFGIDVSSDPNNMVATLIRPVPALVPGMTVRIKKNAAANLAPMTLNIGLGANTVTRSGGAATQAGDIPANAMVEFTWDGSVWQMVNFQGFNATTVNNNNFTLSIPYTADTSVTPNTIVAPFSPAITSFAAGDLIKVKLANTVTGATVINVNALPSITVVRPDGSPIRAGDIVIGQVLLLEFDGVNFQVVNMAVISSFVRGAIYIWPLDTPPAGTLECNGAAVSRSQYSALFAVIGTAYGAGDGSTTFNVPDYRGWFLRGWDHGAGIDPNAAGRTNRGDGTTGDHVGTLQQGAVNAVDISGSMELDNPIARAGSALDQVAHEWTDMQLMLVNDLTSGDGFNPGWCFASHGGPVATPNYIKGSLSFSTSTGSTETRPKNKYVMYVIAI